MTPLLQLDGISVIGVKVGRVGVDERTRLIPLSRVIAGQVSVLPELCGFSREEIGMPVPYPTACAPQMWAATTPIQLITSLMRYDPDISAGALWLDPVLPDSYGGLRLSGAPLGQGPVSIDISGSDVSVTGVPAGVVYRRGRRPWITKLIDEAPMAVSGLADQQGAGDDPDDDSPGVPGSE